MRRKAQGKGIKVTGFLIASCVAGACAKPEPNPDGKPVAISPMRSRESVDSKRVVKAVESPSVRGTFLAVADFERGTHDGTYVQDRCVDGLRGSTVVEGTRISLHTEIFYDARCKEPVQTNVSVWRLGSIEGNAADFVPLREARTLWRESEVASANAPESTLDAGFYTLLSIDGDALRWGAPGRDPVTAEMLDGSKPSKRHRTLEELPYLKDGNGAPKTPVDVTPTATPVPTAAPTIAPASGSR